MLQRDLDARRRLGAPNAVKSSPAIRPPVRASGTEHGKVDAVLGLVFGWIPPIASAVHTTVAGSLCRGYRDTMSWRAPLWQTPSAPHVMRWFEQVGSADGRQALALSKASARCR